LRLLQICHVTPPLPYEGNEGCLPAL
jgi:hypothetical protein